MKKISLFSSLLLLILLSASFCQAANVYPPYPDIWDWIITKSTGLEIFRLKRQNNGDILVYYKFNMKNQEKSEPVSGALFFSGQDFSRVDMSLVGNAITDAKPIISLRNGIVVSRLGVRGARSRGCYNDLDGSIVLKDKNGSILYKKKIFYILEKPRLYRTKKECLDGSDFYYRTESVFANFIALDDGTFLVVDEIHGIVIRFDDDLQTRSMLLNDRVFLMDEDLFETFEGNYGDRAIGSMDLGRLHRDLYRLLMKMKS